MAKAVKTNYVTPDPKWFLLKRPHKTIRPYEAVKWDYKKEIELIKSYLK